MSNLLVPLIDGSGKDLGQGGIVAIISILLVFALLALIILITLVVGKIIEKTAKQQKVEETSMATPVKEINISDEDATVAVLVASIDYRNQTKKNIKVISVKEIK